MNCVGFHNYKYFLLLLLYAGSSCLLISLTYWEVLLWGLHEAGFLQLYAICMAYLLALTLALVLNAFFAFHVICLLFPNFTTIEFCEKRKSPNSIFYAYSPFNRGLRANISDVLGPNVLLWLAPCSKRRSQ